MKCYVSKIETTANIEPKSETINDHGIGNVDNIDGLYSSFWSKPDIIQLHVFNKQFIGQFINNNLGIENIKGFKREYFR